MCLWNPFADVSSKINYDTFKVDWEGYRYSLPVCLEIYSNLCQRIKRFWLCWPYFSSGKPEGKYSIQCYLPVLIAFTVISFAAVFFFLCCSHSRENGADRKRMLRRLPSRLFSPFFFFWRGGCHATRPFLPAKMHDITKSVCKGD